MITLAAEHDVALVAHAGEGWPEDADLDLVGAMVGLEAELRAAEFDALETLLRFTEGTPPDDHLVAPRDPRARTELGEAIVALGWHRPPWGAR